MTVGRTATSNRAVAKKRDFLYSKEILMLKSPSWGCAIMNRVSSRLDPSVFLITSDGTYNSNCSGTFSGIDLSLCSPSLAMLVLWRVLPDLNKRCPLSFAHHSWLCQTFKTCRRWLVMWSGTLLHGPHHGNG